MIVYVASFPRSGNFWMQNLLGNQFKRLTTNIHESQNPASTFERWRSFNKKNYDIDGMRLDEKNASRYGMLAEWMVRYRAQEEEGFNIAVLPACPTLNTEEARQILAGASEHFFIKTHYMPYKNFYEGEYVLQLVRNSGASLWSYYNFKRDRLNNYDQDLASIIRGDIVHDIWDDNWSRYYLRWNAAAEQLGSKYMLVRYEEMFGNELAICERIQDFLGLPIKSRELRPFDYYHKLRPGLTREGKKVGWEGAYSKNQLKLLWQIHGKVMSHFNYPEPDYASGLDHDVY